MDIESKTTSQSVSGGRNNTSVAGCEQNTFQKSAEISNIQFWTIKMKTYMTQYHHFKNINKSKKEKLWIRNVLLQKRSNPFVQIGIWL